MDVVKDKAKISKKAKKYKHFETSLYPESSTLIIYLLREIWRPYEKLIVTTFLPIFGYFRFLFNNHGTFCLHFLLTTSIFSAIHLAVLFQNPLGSNDQPPDLLFHC